ncbi:MAG TPA: YkoF family thiamine/hydroxymethylpyrimidine-binding protein [Steroidobacteraceae bacterium]|nr:YkoF family thiamine/hydroxymethylpyrimidine-binding protein [Steroidobacteraceae bacterium]
MDIAVEISLYPLNEDFIPPIQDFIDRLKRQPGLKVTTNHLSTQVFGDHDRIFELLRREMGATFAGGGKAIFVTKFIGPYRLPDA